MLDEHALYTLAETLKELTKAIQEEKMFVERMVEELEGIKEVMQRKEEREGGESWVS